MKFPAEVRPRDAVIACLPLRSVGAEIGVNLGINARDIIFNVRPRKLHLIDPWKAMNDPAHAGTWYDNVDQTEMDRRYEATRASLAKHIERGSVEIHRTTSSKALESLGDDSLDWVYVDGDHAYGAVAHDLRLSYAKVKAGGFIAGDDYKLGGWWGDSVLRAVHELLMEKPVKLHMVLGDQFVIEKLA